MNFSIKDFFSKCDQIRRTQRIWSNLLKKSFMENFIFCAVILHFHILPSLFLQHVKVTRMCHIRKSSSLSLVQMKDKMVLSCLKLKKITFKPSKQSMFTFTTKTFYIVNDFGKHCAGVSSLIKLLATRKDTSAQVFPCEFCKIFETTFLRNTSV